MIEVIKAGLYTSIQDLGRLGFRDTGVPVSGAMDQYTARLANQLVGNPSHSALMEFTLTGPVLRFQSPTVIALTGAGFSPSIDGMEISCNTAVQVGQGSLLRLSQASFGRYGYMAVAGGFDVDRLMNSHSYYYGITPLSQLKKGMKLPLHTPSNPTDLKGAGVKVKSSHFDTGVLEAYPGPEFELLPTTTQNQLKKATFTLSATSNRMAYMLDTDHRMKASEILTAPVQPGTVQLTPSGKLMVLMRDAQTTGGYARVLQLTDQAINHLSQKRAGSTLRFALRKSH